jgi:hypothetical protein
MIITKEKPDISLVLDYILTYPIVRLIHFNSYHLFNKLTMSLHKKNYKL